MKKIYFKLVFTFCLLMCTFFYAQTPTNPNPPGGVGGGTPGAQASPIDMYVYVLGIVAMLLIVFFTKKYKSQKI
ncbi:signal peptidase [Chryseobacterium camelliae]|uniref:Signal peptidase n=1 Tax=Chryseobacterium camelliae TaxID=1265445 RepID=A0ABY7QJB5_9FLAO|nr:signal peptidase [Chryseobacterium camelliae]WBV59775.1 signal peptidase [Chryseobacterium camelliae]